MAIFRSRRSIVGVWALVGAVAFMAPTTGTTLARPKSVLVSVNARNTPVRSVLMALARDSGANIAVSEGVSGYVTASVRNVTLAEALDAVLTPLGIVFHRRGRVYFVEPGVGRRAGVQVDTGPTVLPLSVVPVKRAASLLRALFPQASIREDERANALVVIASPSDLQAMRAILQGTDIRSPALPVTDVVVIRSERIDRLLSQLHGAFPAARFTNAAAGKLVVTASPADILQIKATVAALDAPVATPPPAAISSEAIHVTRRRPRDVARALTAQISGLRAAVSGSVVVISGSPDAVARGKSLSAQLDVPNVGDRYAQVYRIRSLDARSVSDLLRRSIRDVEVTVDSGINAIVVVGTSAQHQRIADAIVTLDPPAGAQSSGAASGSSTSSEGGSTDIITLKSFIPGPSQSGAVDAVTAITQAIQAVAADVRVVQLPTPGQIALVGPPQSVRTARAFIDKVDVVPPLVVLDTEVLEIDESTAKNLGLQLGTAAVSTTFAEMAPTPNADGTPARLGRFQAFTRTPVSFTAQLNLLVQNGKGRVLADPRITTLSGRTASIRAGDTISILTTTAGNAGTIASTQVQSFQTGVTLDITPVVAPDGGVTVWLHPVVNSLIGTNAGVPEISTRDTQTTVHLQDNETLVIGGLIQENETRTTTKLPILGDIPLLGRAFRNDNVQAQRNELIIVVTPHVVKPGTPMPGPVPKVLPTAAPLPTLPPNAQLPPPSGQLPRRVRATPGPAGSAVAEPSPSPPDRSLASAVPSPAGLTQTNVFVFGAAPQSNFAKATDPAQIFYARLSPTVLSGGTPVRVDAVTTTNVNGVKLRVGSMTFLLGRTSPGQWSTTFPFPAAAVPGGQTGLTLQLVASRSDGMATNVSIPINIEP
jgi:type II secretory pathway component GspD/PulD (secretin)